MEPGRRSRYAISNRFIDRSVIRLSARFSPFELVRGREEGTAPDSSLVDILLDCLRSPISNAFDLYAATLQVKANRRFIALLQKIVHLSLYPVAIRAPVK